MGPGRGEGKCQLFLGLEGTQPMAVQIGVGLARPHSTHSDPDPSRSQCRPRVVPRLLGLPTAPGTRNKLLGLEGSTGSGPVKPMAQAVSLPYAPCHTQDTGRLPPGVPAKHCLPNPGDPMAYAHPHHGRDISL